MHDFLNLQSAYIQAFLYGGCSLTAALSVLLMPETKHTHLPADVCEAERMCAFSDGTDSTPAPAPAPPPRVLSADT